MTIGGPFWEFKGQPGILGEETVELDPQREHIRFTPFAGADRTLEFGVGPEHVVVAAPDGTTARFPLRESKQALRGASPAPYVPRSRGAPVREAVVVGARSPSREACACPPLGTLPRRPWSGSSTGRWM